MRLSMLFSVFLKKKYKTDLTTPSRILCKPQELCKITKTEEILYLTMMNIISKWMRCCHDGGVIIYALIYIFFGN